MQSRGPSDQAVPWVHHGFATDGDPKGVQSLTIQGNVGGR